MTLPTTGRAAESRRRHAEALEMGGPQAVDRYRASGRLPVRERIALLLDEGSWFETGAMAQPERRTGKKVPGDGVVTGFGRVDGRTVGLIGIDATVLADTTAPVSMRKQGRLIEQAQRFGYPLVLLCDADGGRIPDVMGWRFSGLPLDFKTFLKPRPDEPPVPRAAAVLGPSYGDSALHASTAHFVVMTASAAIALSGPSVVAAAIGEQLTDTELGGPTGCSRRSRTATRSSPGARGGARATGWPCASPSTARPPGPTAPRAAWSGIGLYRWDGQRLLENYAVQHGPLAGDDPREAMLHLAGVVRVALPKILGRLGDIRVLGEVTWRPNVASRAVAGLQVGHG
jgi:hypothetical protein